MNEKEFLESLFKNRDEEQISAFAFNIGRMIEYSIISLKEENNMLKASILDFRRKILLNGGLSDFSILSKFDEHFKIQEYK